MSSVSVYDVIDEYDVIYCILGNGRTGVGRDVALPWLGWQAAGLTSYSADIDEYDVIYFR
jgi:hypothetical protein